MSRALQSRILYHLRKSERPISFIVGSGLTSRTIYGSVEMVAAFRKSLDDPGDQAHFDEDLSPFESAAHRYQAAARFVAQYRGQDHLNKVIRLSVLRAYAGPKPKNSHQLAELLANESALQALERSPSWDLSSGVKAFGQLLCAIPNDRRGVVVTTNFDPLIEVAVRMAGSAPQGLVLESDGAIPQIVGDGVIDVLHVHGHWAYGDTLHSAGQLSHNRPLLESSLRQRLRDSFVVVMAYGGWDDIVSRLLLKRVVEDSHLQSEVAWAKFQDSERGLWNPEINAPHVGEGRYQVYSDVDVDTFLPELVKKYAPGFVEAASARGQIRGWTIIDNSYLNQVKASGSTRSVHGYFDGAIPEWSDAENAKIPRLTIVDRAITELSEAIETRERRLVLLAGPMGEGKSTALRQVAAYFARSHGRVLVQWREPAAGLTQAALAELPRDGSLHLLVSDEADLMVHDFRVLRDELQARDDVVLLLAAQERLWRLAGGSVLGSLLRVISVEGLTESDARKIVGSWASVEPQALGALAGLDESSRVSRLLACATSESSIHGSLLGASLSVRYGDGLKGRMRELLDRLQGFGRVGEFDLRVAFLMIALAHEWGAGDTPGVTSEILASALGIERDELPYLVMEPLGKEAAATEHGKRIVARTRSIARTVTRMVLDESPDDVKRIVDSLIQGAIDASRLAGSFLPEHHSILYASRTIQHPDLALHVAKTAFRLSPRYDLATQVLACSRRHGGLIDWDEFASDVLTRGPSFTDPHQKPAFLDEWATCAGVAGEYEYNIVLNARSIEVAKEINRGVAAISTAAGAIFHSLVSVGAPLIALHRDSGDLRFFEALLALNAIVRSLPPRDAGAESLIAIQEAYIARHNSESMVMAPAEAVGILQETVSQVFKDWSAGYPRDAGRSPLIESVLSGLVQSGAERK